jgi:hypothetical protein
MNRDEFLKQWLDVQSKKLDEKEEQTGVDAITGNKKRKGFLSKALSANHAISF